MFALSYLALVLSALTATTLAAPSPVAQPHQPDFTLGGREGGLARRQDYTQNWKTGGNVQFSSEDRGYNVQFSGAQDFVVGKGWSTGSSRNISYSGTTSHEGGTVVVSIYGWSESPLVEYYIQEYASNGNGAGQGNMVGSLTSDGSTYHIYSHEQVNQPSIVGTTSFQQYISVRQDPRPEGGMVTVKNHFDAWASKGLKLGNLRYQVVATEGWGGAAGSSKYTVT